MRHGYAWFWGLVAVFAGIAAGAGWALRDRLETAASSPAVADPGAPVFRFPPGLFGPDVKTHLVPFKTKHDVPFLPVSISRFSRDEYLLANYKNIYLWHRAKGEISLVTPPTGIPLWNPSAVRFVADENSVYVANYNGQDVLILELLREKTGTWALRLKERLTHEPGIHGPEGVDLTPGGRFMAVANWEGNSLSLFEKSEGRWNHRWTRSLPGAHGVAFHGDTVVASGTKIGQWSLQGEERGYWSSIAGREVMFATCISPIGEGPYLAVADTKAGRVYQWEPRSDRLVAIGENGPGRKYFSMPYCATEIDGELLILSTYQARVVALRPDGSQTDYFFGTGEPYAWSASTERPRGLESRRTPRRLDQARAPFLGLKVVPDYGVVYDEDRELSLNFSHKEGPLSSAWPFYQTSLAVEGVDTFVASNSSNVVFVYDEAAKAVGKFEGTLWDCWATGTGVRCPREDVSFETIRRAVRKIRTASPEAEILQFMKASDVSALRGEFPSSPGQEFIEAWLKTTDANERRHLGLRALSRFKGMMTPFLEVWLVFALSGLEPTPVTWAEADRSAP